MRLTERVRALERREGAGAPTLHVVYAGARCQCDECARLTDEQYRAKFAGSPRLIVNLSAHRRDALSGEEPQNGH